MLTNIDEYAELISPLLIVQVKQDDNSLCGMSCKYLKQDHTLFSCLLFQCDLYVGAMYITRNKACLGAKK
jgi:hypothetical protein